MPNSNDGVTVVLPVTRDCGDEGAVCTEDGRMLSTEVTLTVAGPAGEEEQTSPGNNPATGAPTIRGTARVGATLAYYNSPDSVDAQWYVFVATQDGELLGHYNAGELGQHLEEMLADGSFKATEDGIWVTHEDVNPATGEVEDKHFWLVEHDGLMFGSGWHHDESGS